MLAHNATLSAGIVTAVVGFTSSFAVVLTGLRGVGATPAQAASGLLALCVLQGIGMLILAQRYRIPLTLATFPGGIALLVLAVAAWRYGGELAMYDGEPGQEEALLAMTAEGYGYYALFQNDDFVGYCCFGPEGRVPGQPHDRPVPVEEVPPALLHNVPWVAAPAGGLAHALRHQQVARAEAARALMYQHVEDVERSVLRA